MASQQQLSPAEIAQQNILRRQAVVGNSVKMVQQIYSKAIDISAENVVNVAPPQIRNVGLLLGFIVEVEGEVTNGAMDTANRTPWGTANILREIRFDDFSNYTRIQTSGRHLSMLNTIRQGFGFGGAYQPNLPMDYGDNFGVFGGPATIAATDTAVSRHVTFVPIAYSSTDLRGSIYMASVAATSNLQLTLNQNPFTGNGNVIDKVYSGNANGGWTDNVQVTIYQVYLDQIPRMPDGSPILPIADLNTIYDLKETTYTGVTQGQDFGMAYSNYRAFLSTLAIYDNGGVYNAGSDVNYWALAAANGTNIFKYGPKVAALMARMAIMSDLPDATYLFDSRDTPINTINFGNMELTLNAATAAAGARVIVGVEAFANSAQIKGASSLSV